jgi:hypothetical protein
MYFHSIDTLQSWVRDFEQSHTFAGKIRIIPQDGTEGADTGLVAMRLAASPAEIYLEPPTEPGAEWSVVFEPREHEVRLSSAQLVSIAADVTALAQLCAHLQQKTDQKAEHPRPGALGDGGPDRRGHLG